MSAEYALVREDADARKRALDPAASFIVQAPAGSGKTELLIQRYLRLLSVVSQPEEVLAITFTRKAAFEMRLRVIDAIRRARAGEAPDADHEKLTLALAREVMERDAEHGWRLTESHARMRIETVDAFCAGIARSLPVSSGLGGIGTIAADAEMHALYRQAAESTLDYLAERGDAGDAVERVLRHLDNNTRLYIGYVSRMLASREQWLGITGGGIGSAEDTARIRSKLERNIGDVIQRQLELVDALLPADCRQDLPGLLSHAAKCLSATGKAEHELNVFRGCTDLPQPVVSERLAWRGIADFLLTQKGEWRKTVNKNQGFPPENKEEKGRAIGLLEGLRHRDELREHLVTIRTLPDPHYQDEQWQVLLALFNLLPLAVAELQRLFAERGVCDHCEVALAAGRALGSGTNRGRVRSCWITRSATC